MLKGKKILVFGVANNRSIAWGACRDLTQNGAEVILSVQTDKLREKVERLILEESLPIKKVFICDVAKTESLLKLKDDVSNIWSHNLDGIVHSIAFAPMEAIGKKSYDVSKNEFALTMEISAYSLLEIVGVFHSLLVAGSDPSVVAYTYGASTRVVDGYGIMSIAKAALESIVRQLAFECGPDGIRIHAISPGPVKTLASSAFGDMNSVLDLVEKKSPLRKNIDQGDISDLTTFLLSSKSKRMTGGIHYVDSGINILGS